eukprot:scaffold306425_cov26-Tisochrysis_lutea.AAC.1
MAHTGKTMLSDADKKRLKQLLRDKLKLERTLHNLLNHRNLAERVGVGVGGAIRKKTRVRASNSICGVKDKLYWTHSSIRGLREKELALLNERKGELECERLRLRLGLGEKEEGRRIDDKIMKELSKIEARTKDIVILLALLYVDVDSLAI